MIAQDVVNSSQSSMASSLGRMGKENRIVEIDILKAIGMYFIVLGHILPPPDSIFLYVFNVPLFFIISGCLTKRYSDNKRFLERVLQTLVVPCVILLMVSITSDYFFSGLSLTDGVLRVLKAICGSQSNLGTLWFVYTLIIIRFLYQFIPYRFNLWVCMSFLMIAIVFNSNLTGYRNSIIDVLLAYPVFMVGVYLKRFLHSDLSRIQYSYIAVIGLIAIVTSGIYNSWVMMYDCSYGNDIIMFFIGGVSGSIGLFSICKILPTNRCKLLTLIAEGNILILALHPLVIKYVPSSLPHLLYWIISILVILLFIPIIILTKRYFPIALGRRNNRINNGAIIEC